MTTMQVDFPEQNYLFLSLNCRCETEIIPFYNTLKVLPPDRRR